MPKVKVNDIKMYYEVRGGGPRLMFISGTGGDLRRKPNIFDSPLPRHFEVLSFDQRGLGQTDKPDIVYSMTGFAEDAAGLLAAIGWDRCHVMGVSFGGMVAQEFAIRYPQRVDRLVLACSSSGGTGGSQYPLHELTDLPLEDRAKRLIELADNRYDKRWQETNPKTFKDILSRTVAGLKWGKDELGLDIGARRQLKARSKHDTYERLKDIQMPVYVCGGLYDGIAPPENLKALHREIPNSILEFFEGGHMFLDDDPKAFKHVIQFLKGELED